MPPLIIWALGAIGAAVVARWAVGQARRLKGELAADGSGPGGERSEPEPVVTLKRDPETGIYHPKQ
jgi:hypothetical protein